MGAEALAEVEGLFAEKGESSRDVEGSLSSMGGGLWWVCCSVSSVVKYLSFIEDAHALIFPLSCLLE